ncbi:MAG TPA: hypothetical protein VEK79_26065 [Thermoanaerobaculia bacterium]|nr:hypothetical protein [Thermoanaerobaculia bacterium]
MAAGLALKKAETQPTTRQVYQIAELGKPAKVPTRAPEFDEAVASFNGDRVLHFNHPAWRDDRNDPRSQRAPRK